MREFIIGAIAMGFVVAGIFFLRFWRQTRDRLFGLFALAFFVLSANRLGLAFAAESDDRGDYLYWVRLAAFSIILMAIIDKNIAREARAEVE